MSDFWLINGWRQQSRSTREIDTYLRRARERGFSHYAVGRQGRCYWLVCGNSALTAPQYDIALVVRRTFASLHQAIYLAPWQGQIICIAWQGERLRHCLACRHDAEGLHQLQLVLQQLSCDGKGQPTAVIAKQTPEDLIVLCRTQLCQWRLLLQQKELLELQLLRSARLKSLAQRPPWQQRQRALAASLILLSAAAAGGWLFWPQPQTSLPPEQLNRQAVPPAGVTIEILQELPQLFAGFRHLAGWQWRSAQLQGTRLQAVVVPSYGRSEELTPQLPAGWIVQEQGQQVVLTHTRVTEPLGDTDPSGTPEWLSQGALYFPELNLQSGAGGQDSSYRWQQWQLRLANTDLTELSRLAALLQQANLRVTSLKLQNGKKLHMELTVRAYEPIPITQGERTL